MSDERLYRLRELLWIGVGSALVVFMIGWSLPAVIPQAIITNPQSVDDISVTYHGEPFAIDDETARELLDILSEGRCTRQLIQTGHGYRPFPREDGYIHISIHELRSVEPSISTDLVLGRLSRMSRHPIGTGRQTTYSICDYGDLTQRVEAVLTEIAAPEPKT